MTNHEKRMLNDYMLREVPVYIQYNDEAGEWLWAVKVAENPEFWLEAFPTEEQALDFCRVNALPLMEEDRNGAEG